jgi:hypothetical protein
MNFMSFEQESNMLEQEHEWVKQQQMIDAILKSGMEAYARELPDVTKAFEGEDHTLCCMDEGTPLGDMRSAGSGILTEGDERSAFFQSLKKAGIDRVKSHTGCGAAALYREQHRITDQTVDEVAIEQAKQIAAELGVEYGGHITELKRPEFHNARVVYLDATGRFNPSKVKDLPPGFVVSRRYMKKEQAFFEVKLASQIAFGDHGFGKKFDPEHPLIVVVIGDSNEQGIPTDQLKDELEALTKDPRIHLETWRAPETEEFLKVA